jgi:dihydroorotase-like cyclic amidohydrolase
MKQTDDIWTACGGIAGVQSMLPVLVTEAVHRRRMSLSRLVSLTAGTPARRLGLYPRKGTLDVGSDADLVLVELDTEWTLQPDQLRTRWPLNPFIGRTFVGRVAATLVRGSVVWRNGGPCAEPGFGQLVGV